MYDHENVITLFNGRINKFYILLNFKCKLIDRVHKIYY